MNILIAPDKFKGSLTSFEVCKAIAEGIKAADKDIIVYHFPMADGGDGFGTVMQYYLHTTSINSISVNPLDKKIEVSFQWDDKTETAIIELASASGLVLLQNKERNPLKTSTYGTGLVIKEAVSMGAKKIILGLGGSATNDAGTGILEALGFCFEDSKGNRLKACGENLLLIEKIIPPPLIPDLKFEIACDVQNILYGPNGAAYVYAPQKGAEEAEVKLLDAGLKNISQVLTRITGKNIADIPGTGAAGGIAAGLMSFFDAKIKKGIDIVLEASNIKNKLAEADLIITGEGKIDAQSIQGKVVGEIALLAKNANIPVIAFCGLLETTPAELKELNFAFVESIVNEQIGLEEAMANGSWLLTENVRKYFISNYKN